MITRQAASPPDPLARSFSNYDVVAPDPMPVPLGTRQGRQGKLVSTTVGSRRHFRTLANFTEPVLWQVGELMLDAGRLGLQLLGLGGLDFSWVALLKRGWQAKVQFIVGSARRFAETLTFLLFFALFFSSRGASA